MITSVNRRTIAAILLRGSIAKADANADRAALRAILHGIAKQVVQHARETRCIPLPGQRFGRGFEDEPVTIGKSLVTLHDLAHDRDEVERGCVQRDRATLLYCGHL